MAVTDDLLRAYEATNYVVEDDLGQIVLRIHDPSPQLKEVLLRYGTAGAAFITAYNPLSQETSDEENNHAQAALLCELEAASTAVLKGYGQGTIGDWPPEPSFLAVGIDRKDAEMLGRRYRQNAIIWIGADMVPSLILLK